MAVSTGNQQKSAPLATGTGNSREGSYVEVVVEVLTVSIFFDGTRNNRFNTEAGLKSEQQRKRDISYQNYYSNVALLHDAMDEQLGVHEKIYIEGAGTEKYQLDDKLGLAAAEGRTGLGDRVYEALTELQAKCKDRKIRTLIINVYGFSRGAAFARNFCYVLKNKAVKRSPAVADLSRKTSINLVGIFDTVSSVGAYHYDDVKPLGLDIGKAEGIARVIHLTAQNDYRYHFPLTSISGAIKDGIGFECSFPGAHSDIGGGYPKIYKNEGASGAYYMGYTDAAHKKYHMNWIDYRFFMQKGYYTDKQITFKNHMGRKVEKENKKQPALINGKVTSAYWGYYGTDQPISVYAERIVYYDYQFIFGEIMQDIIKKFAANTRWNVTNYLKDGIAAMKRQPALADFAKKNYAFVMGNLHRKAKLVSPHAASKEIYNQYIHNSLDYLNGVANKGTPDNKAKIGGKPVYIQAVRPKVTQGYR